MSDGDESRTRPRWKPVATEPMSVYSAYIDDETWKKAQEAARQANFTVSSWVRMAIHEYTRQQRVKVPVPPATLVATTKEFRRNVRATPAMWNAVGARALREKATRSGIVAAAITFVVEATAAPASGPGSAP